MRINRILVLGAGAALIVGCTAAVLTKESTTNAVRSGYSWAEPETQAIQNDDFENPAFLWVDYGADLWSTADGGANKSCENCHGDAEDSMKGVGATYPKYYGPSGKLINLELRINECRKNNMKAKPYKYESRELLGITAFVKNQSRGMPVNVAIDGPAAPFFEKGKAFYNQRRGQLDIACVNCHSYPGTRIRANLLTQGQGNGFPQYRLKWAKIGSLHRRFRGCNKNIRAQPYGYGSDEYVNLELFVAWRGTGLPVETPAVRN